MHNILIVTPLVSGTIIAPNNLPYPRLVAGSDYVLPVREQRININRAQCQRIFLGRYFDKYEWVLLMDSDVVVSPYVVDMLWSAWKAGEVPCANTKGDVPIDPEHGVTTSCALIHRTDYVKVDYLGNIAQCQCRILNKMYRTFYVDGAVGSESKN